jgi:hypothetical protein
VTGIGPPEGWVHALLGRAAEANGHARVAEMNSRLAFDRRSWRVGFSAP